MPATKNQVWFTEAAITNLAESVVRGVKWADEHIPTWVKKVKLGDLELSDPQRCVLGQSIARSAFADAGYTVEGVRHTYTGALSLLFDSPFDPEAERWTIRHGFNLGSCSNWEARWGALNHLWAEAIRQRRRGETVTVAGLLDACFDWEDA